MLTMVLSVKSVLYLRRIIFCFRVEGDYLRREEKTYMSRRDEEKENRDNKKRLENIIMSCIVKSESLRALKIIITQT